MSWLAKNFPKLFLVKTLLLWTSNCRGAESSKATWVASEKPATLSPSIAESYLSLLMASEFGFFFNLFFCANLLFIHFINFILFCRKPTHYIYIHDTTYLMENMGVMISALQQHPRGSLNSLRRVSFDVKSTGSDSNIFFFNFIVLFIVKHCLLFCFRLFFLTTAFYSLDLLK